MIKNRFFNKPNLIQNQKNVSYPGLSELFVIEQGLTKYSKSIVKKIYSNSNLKHKSKVLDFGAGTGQLATIFKEEYAISPTCIEIDPKCYKMLKNKGFKVFKNHSELKSKFELVYTSNVLEHIKDDLSSLKNLQNLLIPGGVLVIYVPALPILYSRFDSKVGHIRRYKKSELIGKVVSAGFQIKQCYWVDSLGVIFGLIFKFSNFDISNEKRSVKLLKLYDNLIFPISKMLDLFLFNRVIGKNLMLVAYK